MKIAYEYVKIPNNDFVLLCSLLDEHLNDIVGGEIQRSQYLQYNLTDNIHDIVIAYEIKEGEKIPVGCGSFKRYIPEEGEGNLKETAEIKRMFIKEELRGYRIGKEILSVLENKAKEQAFRKIILETGRPLAAAMKLYMKFGFHIINNYGQYKDMNDSVCMEKKL